MEDRCSKGLYDKFIVTRTDGGSDAGEKHHVKDGINSLLDDYKKLIEEQVQLDEQIADNRKEIQKLQAEIAMLEETLEL